MAYTSTFSALPSSTSANAAGLATRSTNCSAGASSCIWFCRKSTPSSGAFRHSRAWPPGSEQVGQAAHEPGVVLGGDEAALLVAGRVRDDQAVGAAAGDLAPAAENVVRQKAGPVAIPLSWWFCWPMAMAPWLMSTLTHLFGPTVQCHHGKRAGVGEQVEHLEAIAVLPAGLGILAHPAAAFSHVQEQAMVLAAQHMGFEARAVLGDYVRVGHLPCISRVSVRPWVRSASLRHWKTQFSGCPGARTGPALGQGGADGGQLRFGLVGGWQKAGEHEHGRVGVQRPLLAAGVSAATAVEDALRIGGQGHGGDGAEQGLHRGSDMERSCPPPRCGAGASEWMGSNGRGQQRHPHGEAGFYTKMGASAMLTSAGSYVF